MRCHDAKEWLGAQRDNDLNASTAAELQEHLDNCSACRAFEQYQRRIERLFSTATPRVQAHVSTASIMRAVQQQKKVTDQLEDIHQQQKLRIERIRTVGAASVALGIFTLSSIPLLILAITIVQTDLAMRLLAIFSGVIDLFIISTQYLQTEMTLITRDNWLFSFIALGVVIMMGMWLRLMRPPQEA